MPPGQPYNSHPAPSVDSSSEPSDDETSETVPYSGAVYQDYSQEEVYPATLPVPHTALSATVLHNSYAYTLQSTTDNGQANYAYGYSSYTQPLAGASSSSEQGPYSHTPYSPVAYTQRSYSNQDLDANTQRLGDTHIDMGYANPYATASPSVANPAMTPQPTNQASKEKKHKCEKEQNGNVCNAAFARKADLQRHIACVHTKMARYDCPKKRCTRRGDNGFSRKDHLTEHLRSFHHMEIPKRNRAIELEDEDEDGNDASTFATQNPGVYPSAYSQPNYGYPER